MNRTIASFTGPLQPGDTFVIFSAGAGQLAPAGTLATGGDSDTEQVSNGCRTIVWSPG